MKAQLQTNESSQTLSEECQKLIIAKQFLDQHCPLEFGSHTQVSAYVVYYNHLMVFFADGQHCGLKNTKQFVALCGHKESPSTILLQKEDGLHIELSFNSAGDTGKYDKAHINDVQYETPFSAIDTQNSKHTKLWMSFIDGVQHTLVDESRCKCYRSKNGEDYEV
ncbi:malate synthase [Pseudoalteromonas sp. SMS1]|uniref:malate synthase n=1 Tax=Pseudoalteromonas sp. SMS1 TaxID=2908894 RepID=UPI001F38AC8A|nr:malate synthase [Pseudoalteromonas sp. SMS1]MCF2857018.1 malate synthase [Pseudoalteromonas sp. SMS1]